MRAVRYHEHGGPEVLVVDEVDRPEPRGHEVVVEVRAAGVNPVDTYFRSGEYTPAALPMIPGADLAGIVTETGPAVETLAVGDRVFGTGLGRDRQGTYAEYAVGPEDSFAVLPAGVSFDEGAAVALVGVTAWRALVHHAGLEPAEPCLIHGGSGGVGHVAVQLADATGAQVLTTARSTFHDRLERLGADAVFDYRREDLAAAVADVAEPAVVLDHRLDEYLQFDADVARPGARVIGIGNTEPAAGFDDVAAARGKELSVVMMSMINTPSYADVLSRLARLIEAGDIVPDIAETFALEEAAAAQRRVMEGRFFGKLVIEP